MDYKTYDEIKKHNDLMTEQSEHEKRMDAFIRVKEGKNISVNDLQVVQQYFLNSKGNQKTFNIGNAILDLDIQYGNLKDDVSYAKKRLKRRGLDLDKMRKLRRLEQERQRKNKMKELERT